MYPFDLVLNSILDFYDDLALYVDLPEITLVLCLLALVASFALLRLRR
jgi:hypothetical protein